MYAKSKGVLTVAAAGNGGGTNYNGVVAPACISSAIAVGAVDSNDVIESFSSTGKAVDITAPGTGGTSLATPMVSGTIALIKAAHPEYTAEQVQEALFMTAVDLGEEGKDEIYGWSRADAYAAVNYIAPPPPEESCLEQFVAAAQTCLRSEDILTCMEEAFSDLEECQSASRTAAQ